MTLTLTSLVSSQAKGSTETTDTLVQERFFKCFCCDWLVIEILSNHRVALCLSIFVNKYRLSEGKSELRFPDGPSGPTMSMSGSDRGMGT